jgi:ATP-dependent Clp protease ATP-binding subunit ClpB
VKICEVVAKWTGIPIMKMLQENEKLLHLEEKNYIDA